jgi:hypothetical protein
MIANNAHALGIRAKKYQAGNHLNVQYCRNPQDASRKGDERMPPVAGILSCLSGLGLKPDRNDSFKEWLKVTSHSKIADAVAPVTIAIACFGASSAVEEAMRTRQLCLTDVMAFFSRAFFS